MNFDAIMQPWTDQHLDAAQREGWDLFTHCGENAAEVQIQRIDDPEMLPAGVATYLPSDNVAMAMVRCGTGEHHRVARQILAQFPNEWARMERAYAEVYPGQHIVSDMTVDELRAKGYAVVVWNPDELVEGVSRTDLEAYFTQQGENYLFNLGK